MTLFIYLKETVNVSGNFSANHRWFWRFEDRYNFWGLRLQGEAAEADIQAVPTFVTYFKNIIEDGNYSPSQV